uniref:Uncharacterized protein n=1 Tax=Romanomermis culicivorax TaxID=13658 RepID=A0A915IBP4_ROMCU
MVSEDEDGSLLDLARHFSQLLKIVSVCFQRETGAGSKNTISEPRFLVDAGAVPSLASVGVGVTILTRPQQKWLGMEPIGWDLRLIRILSLYSFG